METRPGPAAEEYWVERSRRLQAVVDASVLVNSTLDLRELADHIVGIATGLIRAERGSLFLVDHDHGTLRSLVAQGVQDKELTLRMGQGVVGSVATSGEAVILNDAYGDNRFAPSVDSHTGFITRSLLTVPVRDGEGELVAVLQLLNHRGRGFSDEDVAFLAELGVPFAIALTTARLHGEIVARERYREELRLAAEIQRQLQPFRRRVVPGLALETLARSSLEVGGDYHDIIPDDDGKRYWLVVADISGKGVAAGLIASNVQAYLWSRRNDRRSLARVVAEGSELLHTLAGGRKFATLALAEWRPATRMLQWVSAGHPPILLLRGGTVRQLEATGVPMGILPGQSYGSGRLRLTPGDLLLLYTDGVFEAGALSEVGEFGELRLTACLEGARDPADAVMRVSDALARHLGDQPPEDDISILAAQCVEDVEELSPADEVSA